MRLGSCFNHSVLLSRWCTSTSFYRQSNSFQQDQQSSKKGNFPFYSSTRNDISIGYEWKFEEWIIDWNSFCKYHNWRIQKYLYSNTLWKHNLLLLLFLLFGALNIFFASEFTAQNSWKRREQVQIVLFCCTNCFELDDKKRKCLKKEYKNVHTRELRLHTHEVRHIKNIRVHLHTHSIIFNAAASYP